MVRSQCILFTGTSEVIAKLESLYIVNRLSLIAPM